MPRGLTSQALTIWVAEQWYAHPAVLDLMRAGHTVIALAPGFRYLGEPDLIIHSAAHGWHEAMFDYLPAALTAARRRRKEKK
jgi:hypothetical protein